MAVTQSALVDNIRAKGTALTDSSAAKDRGAVAGNKLRVITGTVEIADGDFDADGDVVVLCPLHIDDVVHGIYLANDDMDTGSDSLFSVGLYEDAAGTILADEDAYADSVTQLQAASATFGTNLVCEARDINNVGESVWQDAGYADRATALLATNAYDGHLYLAITQEAAVTNDNGGGTLSFRVEVSSDN